MESNKNTDTDQILNSILRILVESYEQTAAHSSLMIRDSDLRAGERYLGSLAPEIKNDPLYLQLILGTVLAILLQALIDNLPEELLTEVGKYILSFVGYTTIIDKLSPAWHAIIGRLSIFSIFLMLGIVYLFQRFFSWRKKAFYQEVLSTTLQSISESYSAHSALSVRLQRDRQLRVALEALMLPLGGKSWGELSQARNLPEVRENIDRIAEIDRQRILDMREYDRRGGDFWLELLQATLRNQLPAFVCIYLDVAIQSNEEKQRKRNLRNWRKTAIGVCNAMFKIDKRFIGHQETYKSLIKKLKEVRGFNEEGLSILLEACASEPFSYGGPRAKPPAEFFSLAGFMVESDIQQNVSAKSLSSYLAIMRTKLLENTATYSRKLGKKYHSFGRKLSNQSRNHP